MAITARREDVGRVVEGGQRCDYRALSGWL